LFFVQTSGKTPQMSQTVLWPLTTAAKLQLEIVGGLHSGVSLSLEDGDYIIGSKAESDIVLRDQGVAPQHVVICVDGSRIRAEAIGGNLQIGDDDIAAGHGYRLHLPAVITIGEASLRLSRNVDQISIAERLPAIIERLPIAGQMLTGQHSIIWAAGLVGSAFLLILAVYAIQPRAGSEARLQYVITNDSAVSTGGLPDQAAGEAASLAQEQLQEKLSAAGISTIQVTSNGAHIGAQGRIQTSQADEWVAIQTWFDRNFAPKIVLTTNVITDQGAVPPAFRIQAVYYGEHPYIIESNIRYYEGAIMDSGWILQKINEEGVTLQKGDEVLSLTF
jgi:hypothetical protein